MIAPPADAELTARKMGCLADIFTSIVAQMGSSRDAVQVDVVVKAAP
jgi:hypothetical protein